MFDRLVTYLKESRTELRKVTWPTREETLRYTATVIVVSGALAIFLGGIDYLLQQVLNKFVL